MKAILYKCKWSLTGCYLTKELCFDVTTDLVGFKSAIFNVYQHIIAWDMLAVNLLQNIEKVNYWCMAVDSPKFNLAKICHCNILSVQQR